MNSDLFCGKFETSSNFSSTTERNIIFIAGVSKVFITKINLFITSRKKNVLITKIYFVVLNMFLCVRTVVEKTEPISVTHLDVLSCFCS